MKRSFPSVITFLGMSGVGKSTIGKFFSKKHRYTFLDLDTVLESQLGCSLQHFIDSEGEEVFLVREEEALLSLTFSPKTVFSPGGSVVYSQAGMEKLKRETTIVLLQDSYENIIARINPENRGIIGLKSKSYKVLFEERSKLYLEYADIVVPYPNVFDTREITSLVETHLDAYVQHHH